MALKGRGFSRAVNKVLVEERRFSAASDPTTDLGFQPLRESSWIQLRGGGA